MAQELRRNLRISCSIPVLLRFISRMPEEGWGMIYDISLGGIKLSTRSQLDTAESLFLSFIIGSDFNFENIKGKIMRADEDEGYFTYGIEFDSSVDKVHLRDALFTIFDVETGAK
jgi:hypothetical protein